MCVCVCFVRDTSVFGVGSLCVRVCSGEAEEGDLQSVAVCARVQAAPQEPELCVCVCVREREMLTHLLPVPAFIMSLLNDVFLCGCGRSVSE